MGLFGSKGKNSAAQRKAALQKQKQRKKAQLKKQQQARLKQKAKRKASAKQKAKQSASSKPKAQLKTIPAKRKKKKAFHLGAVEIAVIIFFVLAIPIVVFMVFLFLK